MTTLYDFSAQHLLGDVEDLSAYAGKLVLVVNTASECGYTPQYQGLEELYQHFGADKFVVLGFPCNQFGNQEPGDAQAIQDFCVQRYNTTFPLFAKVEVNGENAHPLWRWLTGADGAYPQPVKWNFTKFLIDPLGRLVKRYEPAVAPHELIDDISALLPNRKS
jgi:glutathione peroxidase